MIKQPLLAFETPSEAMKKVARHWYPCEQSEASFIDAMERLIGRPPVIFRWLTNSPSGMSKLKAGCKTVMIRQSGMV